MQPAPASDLVERRVKAWKDQLIDLTRRNPLLSLSPTAKSVFALTHPAADEWFDLLVRRDKKLRLVAPPPQPKAVLPLNAPPPPPPKKPNQTPITEAERKVLNGLRLKAASALREQGINILFATVGLLHWTDPARGGEVLRTPLLLVPVTLEPVPGELALTLSRFEDDVKVNPTLLHRLAQRDVQFALPVPPDEEDVIPSRYLAEVRAAVAGRPGWSVSDDCVLGRFSFLKQVMYEDLDAHAERACAHPLVRALAGDKEAVFSLPGVIVPRACDLDAAETNGDAPAPAFHVLDADPSQQRAILAARQGQSFVLQGPPGTGKTQTIANIIAEAIADGRRVLFVSEKMAALEAVKKRLDDKNLGHLCLEAHSHKANKRQIIEQLRPAMTAAENKRSVSFDDAASDERREARFDLNALVHALHRPRAPLNLSVYEAAGVVARADADGVADLPFALASPETVSAEQFRQQTALAERLAGFHALFAEADTHPWRGVNAHRFSLDLQTRVRALLGDLRVLLDSATPRTEALAGHIRVSPPLGGLNGADWLLALADLAGQTPCPPEAWLTDDSIDDLRALAQARRDRFGALTRDRNALLAVYAPAVFAQDHDDLRDRLTVRHDTTIRGALGESWANTLAARFAGWDEVAEQVIGKTERLQRGLRSLAPLCGLPVPDSTGAAGYLLRVASKAAVNPRPRPGWFAAPGALAELKQLANEAGAQHTGYQQAKAALDARYTEAVLALDLPALSARFASDYAGPLRVFKPSFWGDRKLIRATARTETPVKDAAQIARDLALAREVNERDAWIKTNAARLNEAFGPIHYRGLATDWDALKKALEQTEAITTEFSGGVVPAALVQRLVDSGPAVDALRDQAAQTGAQFAEAGAALQVLAGWVDLANLPFTDAPPAQMSLTDLVGWCGTVQSAARDHQAARETVMGAHVAPAPTPFAASQLAADLAEAKRLALEDAAIQAEQKWLERRFARFYRGLDTPWNDVLAALDWSGRLRAHFAFANRPLPTEFVRAVAEGDPAWLNELAVSATALNGTREQLRTPLRDLAGLFPPERLRAGGHAFEAAPLADVRAWVAERERRLPDLERWIGFQNLRQSCADAGLLSFFENVSQRRAPQEQVAPAFRKRFYQRWLDATCDADETLGAFRGDEHERKIARFVSLDQQQMASAPARIEALAASRRPRAMLDLGETGVLKKQFAMKRPWAIRKTFSGIPNLLFTLKPCLMMSPLSVSLFLDANVIRFDLVIFDEASQIFTEDAVGAVMRGKQVIIAGDSKQLPPTSFFRTLEDEGDEAEEEEDEATNGARPVSASEYESVLKAADAIAVADSPYFGEHALSWHYRSRHESLIAFSRRHFYDRLVSFPAARQTPAVRFVHVPGGVYQRGAKRDNPVEAGQIADLIVGHVRERPGVSLGVITFNEAQQNTILEEIEQRKTADAALAPLLREEGSEGFFVKNIENVQGDERDVIILGVGYGRDAAGKLSLFFGPLSQEGGERRLNVAVTRARAEMIVVSSVLPSELNVAGTAHEGPKLLRAYLEYAQSVTPAAVEDTDDNDTAALPNAVARALRRRGHVVRTGVGLGDYRVDVAVADPDDGERLLLGIECDGPMYERAETARARDRLRPDVLQTLGWRLARVWSLDWVRDPEAEVARLERALAQARAGETTADTELEANQTAAVTQSPTPSVSPVPKPLPGNDAVAAPTPITKSAPTIPAQQTGDKNLPPGVSAFRQTDVAFTGGAAALYGDAPGDRRAREIFVQTVVTLDGPLPLDALAQRLTEAAGLGRTGARIREIVQRTVNALAGRSQITQDSDGFLWPHGMTCAPPRVPTPGERPRAVEHVCREEIGELIVALLKVAFGMRRDELVTETARVLGYNRTGANVRERIEAALNQLELDSRVHIMGGQVHALELDPA